MTPPAVPPGFAAAAGFAGPLALRVEHATAGVLAEGELDQPLAVIGSDPRNEVALNDPALPARLACLQVIDGTPTVFPFDTLTPAPLDADAPWSVGPFTLRLTAPPVRRVVASGRDSGLTLEARNGAGASEFWVVSERVTFVGRSERCEVRVTDADEVHAYILMTADGPWVVDVLSDDGTAVNGEQVRAARLLDGDELTVGDTRFVCRLAGSADAPSALPNADGTSALPGDPWGEITIGPRSASPLFSPELDAAPPPPDDLVTLTPIPPPTSDQLAGVREQILAEFRHTMGEMTAEFDRMKAEQAAAVHAEVARL
ncbi:MAG: FHA domain-containing protein, partial [Gemmataceae bacterium]